MGSTVLRQAKASCYNDISNKSGLLQKLVFFFGKKWPFSRNLGTITLFSPLWNPNGSGSRSHRAQSSILQ